MTWGSEKKLKGVWGDVEATPCGFGFTSLGFYGFVGFLNFKVFGFWVSGSCCVEISGSEEFEVWGF